MTFKRYEEALRSFEEAEKHPNHNWRVTVGLIRTHQCLKNFREALEFVSQLKELKDHHWADEEFKEQYFGALLGEGDCYNECQEYEAAANCFRDILSLETGDKGWLADMPARALLRLFKTWIAGKVYTPLVDLLRSWRLAEDPDRGPAYWLQKTVFEATDEFHGCIIRAAKHADAFEDVCALYQEAIDYLSLKTLADANRYDPSTRIHRKYFQAALRLYGSLHEHDHNRGLQSWEDIVRKSDEIDDY